MPRSSNHHSGFILECSICPKDPTFSDVSHLLTHVSSKSHLSHFFKLQIRSGKEPECQKKLDDYHIWYTQNNLAGMLADRLEAKDQKTSRKKKASETSLVPKASHGPAKSKSRGTRKTTTKKGKKKESTPEPASEVLAHTPMFRAPVPRMHDWEEDGYDGLLPAVDGAFQESVYATPTARRRIPHFSRQDDGSGGMLDPKLNTPTKFAHNADDDDEYGEDSKNPGERLTDSAALKGIVWDGMGIFDSATPEMKRMRNQRKGRAVLDDMKATSLAIEPDEVSFHPNGDFRASRDIFGPLSAESSPVQLSPPSPKRRKARKTANTLLDISVNAPRIKAPRGNKNPTYCSPQKRSVPTMLSRPNVFLHPAPVLNPLAADHRYMPTREPFAPTPDEEEDFRLAFGDFNGNKKRVFTVFNDGLPEISPGRTETPLEDHRFDFPPSHGLPLFQNTSMTSTHDLVSPTPESKPTSRRGFGKESGHEMSAYHHNRRALSDSQVYPTHAFYDSTSNPLFNQTHTRFSGFGANNHPHGYSGSYPAYGEQKSPGGFGPHLFNDYSKSNNSMPYMGQQPNSGMGNNNAKHGTMNFGN